MAIVVFGFYLVHYTYTYIQTLNFNFHGQALPIFWIVLLCGVGILMFLGGFKSTPKKEKYVDGRGYVVLSATNELEHRALAKEVLGRDLSPNEIVHHINGRRTDNDVRNLCVMDTEKHEHHHSWLKWKKEKTGRYPSIAQQKKALEGEYGGMLLESVQKKSGT